MPDLRRGLLPLALGVLGCSPPPGSENAWIRWFPDSRIYEVAVAPDGRSVVAGASRADEMTSDHTFVGGRPWFALLDVDGEPLAEWAGYSGHALSAAMDEEGRAYVALSELRDEQDWTLPRSCELWALDVDGEVRWSKHWDADQGESCFVDVMVVGELVFVKARDGIEAFDLDGRSRWQRPSEADGIAVVFGETVGQLDSTDGRWSFVRYDVRDGRSTSVPLELDDDRLVGFTVNTDGLFVASGKWESDGSTRLTAFTPEGLRRWQRELSPATPDFSASPGWLSFPGMLTSRGEELWVIGGERWFENHSVPNRDRMVLDRWTTDGGHKGALRYVIEDAAAEAAESVARRNRCGGTLEFLRYGAAADQAVFGPEGELYLTAFYGCRDAFLLRMEVGR